MPPLLLLLLLDSQVSDTVFEALMVPAGGRAFNSRNRATVRLAAFRALQCSLGRWREAVESDPMPVHGHFRIRGSRPGGNNRHFSQLP
jgi:hypothetical protein